MSTDNVQWAKRFLDIFRRSLYYDYKKEKVEFARELGVNGANNTEVNAKMAAQDEAKYSKETMNRKHRFVNPQESENHRY